MVFKMELSDSEECMRELAEDAVNVWPGGGVGWMFWSRMPGPRPFSFPLMS
jgi:hypothetical protein